MGRTYTILMALLGAGVGLWTAIYPLLLLMRLETARTGFDAGNGAMLLVCTVPVFTPLGAVIGGLIGRRLDRRDR